MPAVSLDNTSWSPEDVCGPYQLLELLGRGGMGEVWKALDSRLGRWVALKFLAPHHLRDRVTRGRFALESRAVSSLNHPNILTVYEAGELEGFPFIASELVEGRDLSDVIQSGEGLETARCLDIASQILNALESAHSLGIVHRDIKPQNIRLRRDGIVKVLDFGVAKMLDEPGLSLPGRVVGTPRYMAPEQVKDTPLDERADLFSVGAVLFELLVGRPAFPGNDIHQVLQAVIREEPPEQIPDRRLQAVVSRALKKDREERFSSAAEMRAALKGVRGEVTLEEPTQDLSWCTGSARVLVGCVSSRPELSEVAEGVTREIQNRMTLDSRVRVVAADAPLDLETARRRLAHYLLEGNLRRVGDQVRFQATLVEVEGGFKVWGETLTTAAKAEFELEDELVEWLDEGCCGYLQEQRRLFISETAERELRQLSSSVKPGNVDSLEEARVRLEELLEQFPASGLVQAHLSMVLAELSRFESVSGSVHLLEQAEKLARAAIARTPGEPVCQVAAARALLPPFGCDWERARLYLERALEVQSDLEVAQTMLALVEVQTGLAPQAVRRIRRLLPRCSESAPVLGVLSLGYLSQGRFLEARDPAERMLRANPGEPLGLALSLLIDLYAGSKERVTAYLPFLQRENRRLLDRGKRNPLIEAALFLHQSLNAPEAARQRSADDFDDMLPDLVSIHVVFSAYVVLGDMERAEGLLKELCARGYRNHLFLAHDPFLEIVRRQPWFREALDGLGQG